MTPMPTPSARSARLVAGLGLCLCLWAALPAAHAAQACYDQAQSQAQLNACAAADLKQADDQLNRFYKEMLARLKGDEKTRAQLVDAQRQWLAFRDAECSLQTVRSAGGSINAMNVNSCFADLTQVRAKALQDHLDCARQAGEQEAAGCAIPRAR